MWACSAAVPPPSLARGEVPHPGGTGKLGTEAEGVEGGLEVGERYHSASAQRRQLEEETHQVSMLGVGNSATVGVRQPTVFVFTWPPMALF